MTENFKKIDNLSFLIAECRDDLYILNKKLLYWNEQQNYFKKNFPNDVEKINKIYKTIDNTISEMDDVFKKMKKLIKKRNIYTIMD